MTTQTLTLKIEGMTCNGCVNSVNRILNAAAGVIQADTSLAEQQSIIRFDPSQTDAAALIAAIEEAGFDAAEK
ncbi:heavy-metal-associated domain-containing protein [Neisseria lisongii]|nr:heavy metal-associated domain-containing protein [Neisseria lisongii]MCF7528821.1 cation transporter [Neisseria lisongii]